MEDEDVYAAISIHEMAFNKAEQVFEYDCVCGDFFKVSWEDLRIQQEHYGYKNYIIAQCPTCGLKLKVLLEDDIMDIFA